MITTFDQLLSGITELKTVSQQTADQLTAQTQRAEALELIRQQHDAQIASLQRSVKIEAIIYGANLLDNLNIAYDFGGTWESNKMFDCSSFVQKLFLIAGIKLPRTSKDQATMGIYVPVGQQQRGDLLFFDYNGDGVIDHVAIYLGDGTMIHTNTPATGINIKATGTPKMVRRII